MDKRNVQAGDVVMLGASFGGQTKIRPAIVIEVNNERLYVSLGSTKYLINNKHSFVVNEDAEMKKLGLKYHTRFGFGEGADIWVGRSSVTRAIGRITNEIAAKLGKAWANSRFVRTDHE